MFWKVKKQKWKSWEEYLLWGVPQYLAMSIIYNGEKLQATQVSNTTVAWLTEYHIH